MEHTQVIMLDMMQIWHLVKAVKPTEALKQGLNSLVCGDCNLQGDAEGKGRTCYVNLGQGPRAVWQKWQAGGYPKGVDERVLVELFKNRSIRFGAYGNPSNLPIELVRLIRDNARLITGYIHDWKDDSNNIYNKAFMGSTESIDELELANSKGFRSFRVRLADSPIHESEIECLADSKGIKCIDCGLCDGSKQAKNIYITVHGTGKNNFNKINEVKNV